MPREPAVLINPTDSPNAHLKKKSAYESGYIEWQ